MITPTMIMATAIIIMVTTTIITTLIRAMSMTSIAGTPMVPCRANSPAPAAGAAALARFSRWGCAPVRARSWSLVFALAQGLFWAGIVATFVMGLGTAITVATIAVIAVSAKDLARRLSSGREGGGALIMRGIEFGAAGLVLLFGIGLLFGYLAAERVTCL